MRVGFFTNLEREREREPNSMPALGPTIGPQEWESFHLDKSFCLICSKVNKNVAL